MVERQLRRRGIEHERVLEVGTGSGYGAAVLGRCCREVVTIERHAPLAESARAVLAELGYSPNEIDALRAAGAVAGPEDVRAGSFLR